MLEVRQLGLTTYADALQVQEREVQAVMSGRSTGVVLALRHPPVITLGRRTEPHEIHVTESKLRSLGIDLFRVKRGGGATYHYPGQAVVYPIFSLERAGMGVPSLLEAVAEAVVLELHDRGVRAAWDPKRPGAYVGGAKIASVGFSLSRGVTTHGVALNVLRGYELGFSVIDPCKEPGLRITCIEEWTGLQPDPGEVALGLARRIRDAIAHA